MRFFIALAALIVCLTSCKSSWTEEERSTFKQSCVATASQASDAWPTQTCDCLAQKLEASYPNPNDMEDLLDSLHQNPVLLFDKYPECRIHANDIPVEWTPVAEKAFFSSCQTLKDSGQLAQSVDCPCILAKVKKRFVTTEQMNRLNAKTMQAFADECAGKRGGMLY